MKVIYAGTFDPPTLAHFEIIERGAKLFEEVVVAVGINSKKETLFSLEERLEMLSELTKEISNVTVLHFSSLLVDFAKEIGATVLLRGLRSFSDFEQESMQAEMNRRLSGMDTLFMQVADPHRHISSTLVKEIASRGGRIDLFVPRKIEKLIKTLMSKHSGS